MDIDEDCNSNVFKKPTTSGLNFNANNRMMDPNNPSSQPTVSGGGAPGTGSFSHGRNTPFKSHLRRGSSSGVFFNTMFCMSHHFRHLKRLHMESMEGLNIIKQPPARAVFRSSLPATPIATPIYRESFPYFTEQTLMERLCRTPSPRRSYSRPGSQMETSDCEGGSGGAGMAPPQPMDVCSPTIDEESTTSTTTDSSPNKDQQTPIDVKSSLNDIYYKISDQFNPD